MLFLFVCIDASNEERKPLTINNIVENLKEWSDNWIQIANLLSIPSPVINTINVLTSHQSNIGDKDPLYKVIEWWFVNTANPEWTTINDLLSRLSKGM